jgi:hypothetical protein
MSKILFIAIAAAILIVAIAVGFLKFMEIGPFAPLPPATAEMTKPGDQPPAPPRFLSMDPFVIPIIQNDEVAVVIQIQVQLETSSGNESEVRRLMPKLYDAFLRDLNGYLPRLIRSDGQPDANKIRSRMFVIGERTIGKGLIDNVLIQSVIDQPGRRPN